MRKLVVGAIQCNYIMLPMLRHVSDISIIHDEKRKAYIHVEENELPDMLVTGECKAYATTEIDATSYDVNVPVGFLNFMDRTSP